MAGRGRAGNQLPSTDTLTCQESGAARDGVTAPGGPAEAGASGSSREMELEGDTESEACEKRHQDRVPGVSKLVLNLCPVCLASYGNPVRGGLQWWRSSVCQRRLSCGWGPGALGVLLMMS
jgi:hypothetical protein